MLYGEGLGDGGGDAGGAGGGDAGGTDGGDAGGAVLNGLGLAGGSGVDWDNLVFSDVCSGLSLCWVVAAKWSTVSTVVVACDTGEDSPVCCGALALSSWVLGGTVCVASSYLMFILRRTTGAVILHTGMSPGLRLILAW